MIELYDHQKEAVDRILKQKHFAIFYEVGTGKTLIGLDVIRQTKKQNILIVVPKAGIPQWNEQLESYCGRRDVVVINPESLIRKKELTKTKWDIIIVDEAHKVKSPTSQISKMIKDITKTVEYSIALTGTPVANSYLDLYRIYENMSIKEFTEKYKDVLDRYFDYELKQVYESNARYYQIYGIKRNMADEFKSRMKKHCLIKTQEECIQLPEKVTHVIDIEGFKTARYKEIASGIKRDSYGNKDTMLMLEKLNKLHQAANGFQYTDDGKTEILIEDNPKIKVCKELVEDSLENTQQIIVVFKYKQDNINLQNMLNKLNISYTLDAEEFKTDKSKRVLLRQYQKSEAVNLQFCKIMIFYSYDFSFVNYDQMCGRIYRNGQKENVTYYILRSKGTQEENVWKAIERKSSIDEYIKSSRGEI